MNSFQICFGLLHINPWTYIRSVLDYLIPINEFILDLFWTTQYQYMNLFQICFRLTNINQWTYFRSVLDYLIPINEFILDLFWNTQYQYINLFQISFWLLNINQWIHFRSVFDYSNQSMNSFQICFGLLHINTWTGRRGQNVSGINRYIINSSNLEFRWNPVYCSWSKNTPPPHFWFLLIFVFMLILG